MRNDIAGLKSGVAALQMQGHEVIGRLDRMDARLDDLSETLDHILSVIDPEPDHAAMEEGK